jgi:2'-5' RNA ligase
MEQQPDKPTIRTFIAIDLPAPIQKELEGVINQLKGPHTSAIRWVSTNNIHVTLKFLGDISSSSLETLTKAIKAEASRFQPFEVKVADLGAFPNIRRPRVVWVGLHAPPALEALQRGIESETRKIGYSPEERPFTPHLTLGRVAHNASLEAIHQISIAISNIEVGELGVFWVDSIRIYRSDLRPTGSIYTPLVTSPLGQSN